MILPARATTTVVMMIEAVGLKRSKPPPRIIFAMEFVIVTLQALKIAITIKAIRIPMTEETKVSITDSAKKSLLTKDFSAPIALIVPISLVLSITEITIVFIMIINTTMARIIISILNTRPIPSTVPE